MYIRGTAETAVPRIAVMVRLTAKEPNAAYITINLGEVYITEDIKEKSFGVDGYLDETLAALKKESESFC